MTYSMNDDEMKPQQTMLCNVTGNWVLKNNIHLKFFLHNYKPLNDIIIYSIQGRIQEY